MPEWVRLPTSQPRDNRLSAVADGHRQEAHQDQCDANGGLAFQCVLPDFFGFWNKKSEICHQGEKIKRSPKPLHVALARTDSITLTNSSVLASSGRNSHCSFAIFTTSRSSIVAIIRCALATLKFERTSTASMVSGFQTSQSSGLCGLISHGLAVSAGDALSSS